MIPNRESELYQPVKDYLEALGYLVKGEVKGCDITATKDEELLIVELKRSFTLELIYQAIDRQAAGDAVYVAVPFPADGYGKRYQKMCRLCKRLDLGLILVGFSLSQRPMVDVAVLPNQARVRKNRRKRDALLAEHHGRSGSLNTGGVTRRKILTVYKEQALDVARLLSQLGPSNSRQLREAGACPKTASILSSNFYGWYQKLPDKTYQITEKGLDAIREYHDILA